MADVNSKIVVLQNKQTELTLGLEDVKTTQSQIKDDVKTLTNKVDGLPTKADIITPGNIYTKIKQDLDPILTKQKSELSDQINSQGTEVDKKIQNAIDTISKQNQTFVEQTVEKTVVNNDNHDLIQTSVELGIPSTVIVILGWLYRHLGRPKEGQTNPSPFIFQARK